MAHDFNNMLGAILGHAELAMELLDPAQPLHGHLEEIQKAARRSADLTRQLLAFARKQTVAPKVLDLNQTIAGMLKMPHIDKGFALALRDATRPAGLLLHKRAPRSVRSNAARVFRWYRSARVFPVPDGTRAGSS